MSEIKLYKSRWKAFRLFLLTLPFVTLSLYEIVFKAEIMPVFVSWISLLFFGLGIPISLFNFFDRRPQIIINEIGVFDRMAYNDFINWNLIEDAYLVDISKQKLICLVISDAAIHLIKKRNGMKFSKQMGFQEINLSLGYVKIDEIKFLDFILAMSKAENHSRSLIISNFKN